MTGTFYLDTSFIIASVMNTKNKHQQENFVTLKEINITKNILRKKFKEKGVNISITDDIDYNFFDYIDGIFVKNKDVTLYDLINRYQGHCYSNECFMILWNDNLIFQIIENIKLGDESVNSKSLEKILNKIIANPELFYYKIAQELSLEEYNYIKSKINNKSCINCINECLDDELKGCFRWNNPILVGKSKVLRKN